MPESSSDVVRVGQADHSLKKHRRNFLKSATVVGLTGGALAVGGKLVSDVAKSRQEIHPAAQLEFLTSAQIQERIPEHVLPGIGQIEFVPQSLYGPSKKSDFGTAHVFLETDTDLVLVTAEHLGKGFFWQDVNLYFPFGKGNNLRSIDARIGLKKGPKPIPSPEDWWIRDYSKISNVEKGIINPVRAIYIAKPQGYDRRVVPFDYLLQAAPEPQPGETFMAMGFSQSGQGAFTYSTLTYERMTKPDEVKDAGIPLMEFSGIADHGMSGGAIMRRDGLVTALVRGPSLNPGKVLGIPFAAYQPLSNIFNVLKP